jgi:hypothetical protein
MISADWSPSVRLFEAAACGTPIISDRWHGLVEPLPEHEAVLIVDYTTPMSTRLRLLINRPGASSHSGPGRSSWPPTLVQHALENSVGTSQPRLPVGNVNPLGRVRRKMVSQPASLSEATQSRAK